MSAVSCQFRASSLVLLLAWLLAWPGLLGASGNPPLKVRWAATELVSGIYLLNADIDYRLTRNLNEALHNGVKLTFEVQIEINRSRDWMWDATVAELVQRYRVEYHALSRLYIVTHLNTGVQRAFYRLESAMSTLGDLQELPLLDASLLDDDRDYAIRLRARLKAEDLPLPLRVRGYVSREWSPVSEWYSWSLR
ncbi:DUF4390 domain-containing protein [Ectothiorhodospira lacustris]|uniref:DUF4390 domain-containing protein n=1 Tax=Ectothiorhodospira lacustris TaxID=2899127 RepID=UPI001EE8BBCE|nr:DUF4390 domain-containing protein [Ectothiorhodospira lacustris]MCG5501732.1 DUF4390 domain-containing protein [Ectothiorhodospira lacustris]MCG5509155.1 DUF4390 domain-containing protein [Ectothiorhodospira lacustris]MCG5520945.1 DUF4390 domain-containing protein [Ectothiorhodospira lacustris]